MIEKSQEVVIKTKPKALNILQIVAKSRVPLSSGEIEKRILGVTKLRKGKRDPQVHHILKRDLCPQKFKYPYYLFDWNELMFSIKEAKKKGETSTFNRVRRSLVKNFRCIGWSLDEETVQITNKDNDIIEIKANHSHIMNIKRVSNDYAILKLFVNGEEKLARETDLVVKTTGKKAGASGRIKIQIFYEGIRGNPSKRGISYLKTSLNEESRKKREAIENIGRQRHIDYHKRHFTMPTEGAMWTTDQEDMILSEINGNRRHWKYSLNTRGLMLLILDMVNEEYKNRARNVEISNILENLSKNFRKDFPYLMDYNEIKKLYDELEKEEKGFEYFQVNHLKRIALELQDVIDTIDTPDLDYYVSRHYSARITEYYMRYANGLLRPPQGIPDVVRQYFLNNLGYVRDYHKEEFEEAESTINHLLQV